MKTGFPVFNILILFFIGLFYTSCTQGMEIKDSPEYDDKLALSLDVYELSHKNPVSFLTGCDQSADRVTRKLLLPASGTQGSGIRWQAVYTGTANDASQIIGADGSVSRPAFLTGNAAVTLNAALSKGTLIDNSVSFSFIVLHSTQETAFVINSNSNNIQANQQVAAWGKKVLVVWQSNDNNNAYDIRGRMFDLQTSESLGDDFFISTYNAGDQTNPRVALENGKALVVWLSTVGTVNSIRARFIDMIGGRPAGNADFQVNTCTDNPPEANIESSSEYAPEVATAFGKALVIWKWDHTQKSGESRHDHYSLQGRIYDLELERPYSKESFALFHIYPANGLGAICLAASGEKALAVWSLEDTNRFMTIQSRVIDLFGNALTGNDAVVLSSPANNGWCTKPKAVICNNRAVVVWLYEHSQADESRFTINSRLVDLDTGAASGTADFIVNTTGAGAVLANPVIAAAGNTVLTIWTQTGAVDPAHSFLKGRFIDINSAAPAGMDDIVINEGSINTNSRPCIAAYSTQAFVAWQKNTDRQESLSGALLEMNPLSGFAYPAFSVSTDNNGRNEDPAAAFLGNSVFTAWNFNATDIHGRILEF